MCGEWRCDYDVARGREGGSENRKVKTIFSQRSKFCSRDQAFKIEYKSFPDVIIIQFPCRNKPTCLHSGFSLSHICYPVRA